MRGWMLGLAIWSTLSLVACGGASSGGSDQVDDLGVDETADARAEADEAQPCEVPCGGSCCDEGWKCGADDACYQCIKDVQCAAFAGCEGDRCRCTADKVCELKPCDEDCPDWQHCEWLASGMVCVPDVCEEACGAGFRCVDDECEAYCDKACESWEACAWEGDAMVCVERPCEPACTPDKHCEKAACVPNECTGISTDDCEDKGCSCLVDGSCGACTGCPEPCGEGFFCQLVDDEYQCVEIVCEPPCAAGLHCTETKQCLPNVCTPACATGGVCQKPNGTDADCLYTCEPACEDWQWCNLGECADLPCEPACGADQHCFEGACADTVCTPSCPLGKACTWNPAAQAASCVAIACSPACADYEYCDDKKTCQPFVCEPVCEQEEHCAGQDIDALGTDVCVPNECAVTCGVTEFCDKDGECTPICDCSGAPQGDVCGLVDAGTGGAFQIFPSMCELECADAEVANCAALPVQKVCDVGGFLADGSTEANTYDNVCFAACAGVDVEQIQAGACACAMTCAPEDLGDNPVCGMDCFDYANPCDAECAGVTVQFPHPCPDTCGLCSPCDEEEYLDPVCGTNGETYRSLCDLQVCHTGVVFDYPGRCIPDTCPASSSNLAPVCGSLPGEDTWQTFVNQGLANCLDATVHFQWTCTPCDPRPEAPVCAYSEWTGWDVEPNQCIVDSYGFYESSYPGACVCCGAPGSIDGCCDLNDRQPICGTDGVTYANGCALACAGVAKQYDGECTCPSTWAPVCGDSVLEPGKKYTYGNECVAKSVYGVTTFTAGACPLCTLACSGEEPEVVCGLDGVSYPNICYLLKCNGDTIQLGLDDTACNGACEGCPQ